MADLWDDALCEELGMQTLADDIDACEQLRTPSTIEGSVGEGPGSNESGSRAVPGTWWAAILKSAGRFLAFDDISLSQSDSVTLVSACTGCSAESWVFKARRACPCAVQC